MGSNTSFSGPNHHSQMVALIAASRWRSSVRRRCTHLLPRFVSYDQYCAVYSLLCQPLRERDFVAHYHSIFDISLWRMMCYEFSELFFALWL